MFVPHDRCPSTEPTHPPPGTRIDNGALELVEVLGVGGYGVVYRAIETRSPIPRQYAVKCLIHSQTTVTTRQRQLHIREIALHQLAGAHPNVVTLHRVVEEGSHTYIIMDFAPDGDMFSQILYGCRYLGNTRLIKHIFNQLLDAVEYCHSLGIYHRDLKPENVLCFDGGYRIAITDFGLATTEKLSEEFRTGSVYHMSPECQGGEFAPSGSYSPMFNDVWSLGIVLLNLATGRNPWKAATLSDSTFRAYLHNPSEFLTTVLPISSELNAVLVRMLEIDWQHRMKIPELRVALERVNNFYSDGAVFDGSMARCPWEVGVDLEASTSAKESPPHRRPQWSKESSLVFMRPAATGSDSSSSTQYSSCGATWAFDSPTSSDSGHIMDDKYLFERPRTPPPIKMPISPISPCSSAGQQRATFLVTPSIVDFPPRRQPNGARKPAPLTINTNCLNPEYYSAKDSLDSASTGSSVMQTAVDDDPYASSFFLASSKISMVDTEDLGVESEDKEMTSPMLWGYSAEDMSRYCSTQSSIPVRPKIYDDRSATPSPDTEAAVWHDQCQFSSSIYASVTDALPPPRSDLPKKTHTDDTAKAPLRRPLHFFPRSATASGPPLAGEGKSMEPFQSFIFHQTPSSPSLETWSTFSPTTASTPPAAAGVPRRTPGAAPLRVIRPWFLRAKLFGSSGPTDCGR
ncbi:kinase-like domain-containing protein [Mycena alexandri]|uniref:non-specific serine/threonine protein kinase n=1 Tax=Mycena alexandri TaxID=1745969 RepID=A0AAD6X201_9AGAR|nr:kinase-like domain-containing protein [Mycena alexandri]